ncbi:anks1b [Symbiodinium microadriaticum]|nr:anks1b [Symbiodinium microadriaticum]
MHHPDPEMKQMRVFQDALRHLLKDKGMVPLDCITETFLTSAKAIALTAFQSEPLFLWYDYFSVPQDRDSHDQAKAIQSIPAYVAACSFFFALVPYIEDQPLSPLSWSHRGWCRLERVVREISADHTWILIKSSTSLEVVGTAASFPIGQVGEGDFTVPADAERLGPVIRGVVFHKLRSCLKARDFPGYRRHLNLQSVYFKNLPVEPLQDFVPGFDDLELGSSAASPRELAVARFMHQNGFRSVREVDGAGWTPIHYAALSGNAELVVGLLQQRAALDRRTSKGEPKLGVPPLVSALELALAYRQHDSTRALIEARAQLRGALYPAMQIAALADNPEGIRMLCAAGADPVGRNLFGFTALDSAFILAGVAAREELLRQMDFEASLLSCVLLTAMLYRGGTAEAVQRLVGLRADIDFQFSAPAVSPFGAVLAIMSLQHRLGRVTAQTEQFYHYRGMTPLMAAVFSSQYEGAAALIAAGAKLELRNCRGFSAADFAKRRSLPDFLEQGLLGDRLACQRVTTLALATGTGGIVQCTV